MASLFLQVVLRSSFSALLGPYRTRAGSCPRQRIGTRSHPSSVGPQQRRKGGTEPFLWSFCARTLQNAGGIVSQKANWDTIPLEFCRALAEKKRRNGAAQGRHVATPRPTRSGSSRVPGLPGTNVAQKTSPHAGPYSK